MDSGSSRSVTRPRMLPIIGASTIGSIIEWYDFSLYGFLSATVFAKLFFPSLDPLIGTLAAFSTSYIAFIARPIGGAFFGWFGDRIGRKSTLVATLLIMGCSTVLVGFVPTAAQIGIAAPLIITILRFLQGLGVGGEWGGAVLLTLEYGDERRRGFWASWSQASTTTGGALAAIAVVIFQGLFPGQLFYTIGWRIPFLLSSILIIIGLVIRSRILDTPTFMRLKEEHRVAKAPLLDAIRQNWREIILSALARFGEQVPITLFSFFILSYGVLTLGLKLNLLYAGLLASAPINFCFAPIASSISDRVGRKRWYLAGLVLMAAYAFPFFMLLQTKQPGAIILAMILAVGICVPWLYGPQAALIVERFNAKFRYSGSSLGYQLGSIFAGGPAPIIATALIATYHTSVALSLYIIVAAAISFFATLGLKDYTHRSAVGDDKEPVYPSVYEKSGVSS